MKQQTTNPGEHVKDAKIQGPEKCHQHRSFATACKNQRKKKRCTLIYCDKCLLNRYGEKAEEAEASEVWSCPRCGDICTCCQCRCVFYTFPHSPDKRKAMEEEIARASQQTDEEASKRKSDDLVALRNEVEKLCTKIPGIDKNVSIMTRDIKTISETVRKQATTTYEDHQDLVKKVNLLQQSHDSFRETQLHILSVIMEISNRVGVSVDKVTKGEEILGEASCRVEADQEKDDSDHEKDDGNNGDTHGPSGFEGSERLQGSLCKLPESESSQPETVKEKPSESRKRMRDASVQTDSNERAQGENFRLRDDPAPLYDSLSEPLSQKHLDKVETAVVVHTFWNGEVSGEMLIYFLKDGQTMKTNQVHLLLFKEQLELEYLVHIMHDRSFVHRRWINNMKTKIRQITRLMNGTKEEYFRPKYVCDKDGKEKEMPYRSVKIQHDELGTYMEYTHSQVGMSSITLDDNDDYDYTPSQLRAAYWQISRADDKSVKIKRILKKALENTEFKLLDKFLQKNPLFREIPDGYELEH